MNKELRNSGINIIPKIEWGTHFCHFYSNKDDLKKIVVPYIKEGLKSNEYCMWITGSPEEAKESRIALEKVIALNKYNKNKQLEILDYRHWYLTSEKFRSDIVLKKWLKKKEYAIRRGFDGIRVTGDTSWLEKRDWIKFSKYERTINEKIEGINILVLCSYPIEKCDPYRIIDVVSSHQFSLVCNRNELKIIQNSEYNRVEKLLENERNNLNNILNSMEDLVYVVDKDCNIQYMNAVLGKIMGPIHKEKCYKYFNNREKRCTWCKQPQVFKGNTVRYEWLYPRTGRIYDVIETPIKYEKNIISKLKIMRDITDRKNAEEMMRKIAKFPSENPSPVMRISKNGKIIYANNASSILLDNWGLRVGQSLPANWIAIISGVLKNNESKNFDMEVYEKIFNITLTPVKEGNYVNIYGLDITGRKMMEIVLKESERRLNKAQEISHLGSWELDVVNNRLTWSDEVYRIFGLKPQEFSATYEAFLEAIHSDDRAAVDSAYSDSLREGRDTYEIVHRIVKKSTGEVRYVREKCEHIRDDFGKIIRSVGMVYDITEYRKAREVLKRDNETLEKLVRERTEELLKSYKEMEKLKQLSDIGVLAATVAHELRNPLGVIRAAAYNIKRKSKGPLLEKHIEHIEKKIEESNHIINNLLFYSRLKTPQYGEIKIYNLLLEYIGSLKQKYLKSNVTVELKINELKNTTMEADQYQISELFINIIDNAYGAFTDNAGIIKIKGSVDNGMVRVIIEDNGIGVNEEDLKNIFEPFFTTKSKGTGLGLTVCKQIVNLHNGNISVESKINQGTRVIIDLPERRKPS